MGIGDTLANLLEHEDIENIDNLYNRILTVGTVTSVNWAGEIEMALIERIYNIFINVRAIGFNTGRENYIGDDNNTIYLRYVEETIANGFSVETGSEEKEDDAVAIYENNTLDFRIEEEY